MKITASLDGTTALANGQSRWINSPEKRANGHAWRARSCALRTGISTVLQDNPRLDVRLFDTPRQPYRMIVASRLQTPFDAAIFKSGWAVWICRAVRDADKELELQTLGATITYLPDALGKVDLAALMSDLARREINKLHVEADSKLNASLIRAALVDDLLIYLAPKTARYWHGNGGLRATTGALRGA